MTRQIKLENESGAQLLLVVSEEMVEKIIDTIYPDKGIQGISKGYIELTNFFYKRNNESSKTRK